MRIIKLAVIAAIFSGLFGCASGAKVENMAVMKKASTSYPEQIQQNIGVENVIGGQETNPLWSSEISNDDFKEALKQSLNAQGLLAEDAQYEMEVQLVNVDQPIFGMNFTVTTEIRYILRNKQDQSIVMDEKISAPFTAGVGDAFVGVERLRLANEGSAKHNIEILLEKLNTLNIDTQAISLAE
ncbi:hypothetical protein MAMP_01092 [Methylophaga aminisulfidivorans MP]|uniref:Lipoprotein n=1 Tax=Methylophaga aminisulfidivorans MP TaxID=1026882 RepID=F5T2G1_9GAMM|nr:hypothetical protein [Methylophaga aminisulfidivorans]EGL53457.1 hypothetical protein MAMP_01092 [Methylophaga aminisulfidivorans MP]